MNHWLCGVTLTPVTQALLGKNAPGGDSIAFKPAVAGRRLPAGDREESAIADRAAFRSVSS